MLRDATLDDIPALVELGQAMHLESPVFHVLHFSRERLAASIGRIIGAGQFAKVVTAGDEIVGGMLAMAVPHFASDDLTACDVALFVHPAHRGSMAGARLLRAYADWAKDIGAALVLFGITTGVEPEKTETLCTRMGWARVGSIMRV